MRNIIYEYRPVHQAMEGDLLPLSAVFHNTSPYWHCLNATATPPFGTNATAVAAAAAAAAAATAAVHAAVNEQKLVYTPCSYVAADYFIIKPEEWFRIIFTGPSHSEPRPDVIYDPVAAWPMPELELCKYQLALLVQNSSRQANIAVHKGSRLHHLLQVDSLDSCFTLVRGNDNDNMDDDPPPPPPPSSPSPPPPSQPPRLIRANEVIDVPDDDDDVAVV